MSAPDHLKIRVSPEIRLPYLDLLTSYGQVQEQMSADVQRLPPAFQREVFARISHAYGRARDAGLGQAHLTHNLTLLNNALIDVTNDVSNAHTMLSLFRARAPMNRATIDETFKKFSAEAQHQIKDIMFKSEGDLGFATATVFKDFDPTTDQAKGKVKVGPAIKVPYLELLTSYGRIQEKMAADVMRLPEAFQQEVFARLSVHGNFSGIRDTRIGQEHLVENLTALNDVLIDVTTDVSIANHVLRGLQEHPQITLSRFSPTAQAQLLAVSDRFNGNLLRAVEWVFKDLTSQKRPSLDETLEDLSRRVTRFVPSLETLDELEGFQRELQELSERIPQENGELQRLAEAIDAKLGEHMAQIMILGSQDEDLRRPTPEDLIRLDLQGASQYDGTGRRPPACTFHAICAVETLIKYFDYVVPRIEARESREISAMQKSILKQGQQQYDAAVRTHLDLRGGAFITDLRKHSLLPRNLNFQATHDQPSGSFDHRLTTLMDELYLPHARLPRLAFAIIQNGNEETFCVVSNGRHSIIFDSHRNWIVLASNKETTRAYLANALFPFSNEIEFNPRDVQAMHIDLKTCGPNCEVDVNPFHYTCGTLRQ
jgi:hypothetical protein